MPLNLILDPWIPVRLKNGDCRIIRPHEMASSDIEAPNWPRADLNVACLELLIGLVFLADPPQDEDDCEDRQRPDAQRLEQKLLAYKDAFNLTGDGPLFMQDLDKLEGEANPPDMLFIDSAGANTAKNNADLMVRRKRYETLDPALAAMTLFAFQAFAPSGGAGNRTSMRGGGPMTTLVDPGQGLWPLIWANVPNGKAQTISDLPWMSPTRTSDENKPPHYPADVRDLCVETFFGMPRRLRLVVDDDGNINGVIQRPYGTNYTGWIHPLTPYYQQKAGSEYLPVHPKPGVFGYRNWLGIVVSQHGDDKLRQIAKCVGMWLERAGRRNSARLLVAGWAMDNMKPLDFVFSSQRLISLTEEQGVYLNSMVRAADVFSSALRSALQPACDEGEMREALRESFYLETQQDFENCVDALHEGETPVVVGLRWKKALSRMAENIFEKAALEGLADRRPQDIEKVVNASGYLKATLAGLTKTGATAYLELGLTLTTKKPTKEAA